MPINQPLVRIENNDLGTASTPMTNNQIAYPTSSARFCILVRDAIRDQGCEPEQVLADAEIAPSALVNPNNKIPLHKVVRFWERAAEITKNQYFGLHVGQNINVKSLGALGYFLIYSSSVETALRNFERFVSVNQDATETCIEYGAKTFSITYAISDSTVWPRRHEAEASLALRLNLIRVGTAQNIKTVAVHFEHDAPSDVGPLSQFFGDNLYFNTNVNKLTFDREILGEKLLRADVDMLGIIEEHMAGCLKKTTVQLTFAEALEMEIRDAIAGGYLSSELIAEKMAISSRTMRRRLRKEREISFQEFVKKIRLDLACSYLCDEKLTVGEISFLLGYSEESAFCRAFRQWSNMTPLEFRSKHHTAATNTNVRRQFASSTTRSRSGLSAVDNGIG